MGPGRDVRRTDAMNYILPISAIARAWETRSRFIGSLCGCHSSSGAAAAPHGDAAVIDYDAAEFLPDGKRKRGYLRMRRRFDKPRWEMFAHELFGILCSEMIAYELEIPASGWRLRSKSDRDGYGDSFEETLS